MTTFEDGPAKGHRLQLQRAPLFLRVTVSPAGSVDALDQIADTPLDDESVHAYERVGNAGSCHVDGRDKSGRRVGCTYTIAHYKLCAEQPKERELRNNAAWQAWATAMDWAQGARRR